MKKYKNLFALLSFALIFTVAFGGCSGSYSGKSDNALMAEIGEGIYYDYDSVEAEEYLYAPAADMESGYKLVSADSSTAANLPADRKIIRNADITMEVDDVEKSYENILVSLAGFGGYEANRNMQSYGEDNIRVNATFKIPAGKLDLFLTQLKNEGDIKNSNISSNDITDDYHDSKIRLETLEKTLANYYRFLENAEDVDEQLKVTRYINDTTSEIERIKGKIKLWDSLVDYSTVTLYLYKTYEAPIPVREIKWNSLSVEDMGWFITSGFLGVCNAIFSVVQWVVIIIITASPVLIPIAILVFLLIRHHKKNKKNKSKNDKYAQFNQNKSINPGGNSDSTDNK